jgi:hypothetical protein
MVMAKQKYSRMVLTKKNKKKIQVYKQTIKSNFVIYKHTSVYKSQHIQMKLI